MTTTQLITLTIQQLLSQADVLVSLMFIPQMILFFVFGIEGLVIDAIYWGKKLGPIKMTPEEFKPWKQLPQKRIAIMVACWHEEDVIEAMITGNLKRVEYDTYEFFLGVYPNDTATLEIAKRLDATYPRVHCIVNSKEGPTCKGQMINEIVKNIFRMEEETGVPYDVVMYHDSEDAIHPLSLYVVNKMLNDYDFVQIPVFSFPLPYNLLTGGTYMDEFAECHLKELLVRGHCRSSIPSAGVGTAFTTNFLRIFLEANNGHLFNPKSLTEDYELGVTCHRMGYKQILANVCVVNGKNKDYISTREFFPQAFSAAVRQKSRWNLGIMFQAFINLGWGKTFRENYFLYRDRIGLISTPMALISGVLFTYALFRHLMGVNFLAMGIEKGYFTASTIDMLKYFVLANVVFMVNRILHRAYFAHTLYGWGHAFMSPVRLILGNIINCFALIKATKQFITSKLTGKAPKWLKTQHIIPVMLPTPGSESQNSPEGAKA